MADGSFCLLQYDYATPYADPALRDTLPEFQTCYFVLLAALILVWLAGRPTAPCGSLPPRPPVCTARWMPSLRSSPSALTHTARVCESFPPRCMPCRRWPRADRQLQSQWRMEQQRAEQIAALTHDLKTPLSIIQGNADLLAEDALSATSRHRSKPSCAARTVPSNIWPPCAPPVHRPPQGKPFPVTPLSVGWRKQPAPSAHLPGCSLY